MNEKTVALVLGIPGSGKSTVGQALADKFNGAILTASRMLQVYAQLHPEDTASWRDYWSRGENAPDSEVLPVLWHSYRKRHEDVIILDGYPRTTAQLDDYFLRGGRLDAALMLDTPSEKKSFRRKAR